MDKLKASTTPVEDIKELSYTGQPAHMRMYKSGYEKFFNLMPKLDPYSNTLQRDVKTSQYIMTTLGGILENADWVAVQPKEGEFNRSIIAIGEHEEGKQSPEFVVAKWGNGFTSPVHGHAEGYLHEELITGKMRVNTYRLTNVVSAVVRPVETVIYDKSSSTIASLFTKNEREYYKRQTLIHNFTSIGYSATLHYLTEHTRDGKDNGFAVEYFADTIGLTQADVKRIDAKEGMYLQKGDVVLVRSSNVTEYGDHYIVITGHPIQKEHGFRPQEKAIFAPDGSALLDTYEEKNGLILLKLLPTAKKAFHKFHDIEMVDGNVIFPSTESLPLKLESCIG